MNFVAGDKDEAIESELPALEQLVSIGYQYKSQAELDKKGLMQKLPSRT